MFASVTRIRSSDRPNQDFLIRPNCDIFTLLLLFGNIALQFVHDFDIVNAKWIPQENHPFFIALYSVETKKAKKEKTKTKKTCKVSSQENLFLQLQAGM